MDLISEMKNVIGPNKVPNPSICKMTDATHYELANSTVGKIVQFYIDNGQKYQDITYVTSKNSSVFSGVCINNLLYQTRVAIYNKPYEPGCKDFNA